MEQEKNRIKENLAKNLELYVKTFVGSHYSKYISEDNKRTLTEIVNFKDYVKIEETGTISLFVRGGKIYFPESAFKILKAMKFVPAYGSNRNHKTYEKDTLLTNDNTFLDYIVHVFLKGYEAEEYYQENLLHEAMHFCGVGGASALREGMAEYITRKFAQEYSFITSGCGYPKEIKIVLELEKMFGEETIFQIAFSRKDQEIYDLLNQKFDRDAELFYQELERLMEKEFHEKYYSHKFPGLTGPLKKAVKYKDINYDMVYKKIEQYKEQREIGSK